MKRYLSSFQLFELWFGLAFGIIATAIALVGIWAPFPVALWSALAYWLFAVIALSGWDWRVRALLGVGLALLLTGAWVGMATNGLVRSTSLTQYAAFFGADLVGLMLVSLLIAQGQRLWLAAQREIKRQDDLLLHLTIIDPDTGLYKLAQGLDMLNREVIRARRSKQPVAVARFRTAELVPTESWISAISRIPSYLRPFDLVVAVDSREVGIVLPDTGASGAEAALSRMRERLKATVTAELRLGVAIFPDDAVETAELWDEAGHALRLAEDGNVPFVS